MLRYGTDFLSHIVEAIRLGQPGSPTNISALTVLQTLVEPSSFLLIVGALAIKNVDFSDSIKTRARASARASTSARLRARARSRARSRAITTTTTQ